MHTIKRVNIKQRSYIQQKIKDKHITKMYSYAKRSIKMFYSLDYCQLAYALDFFSDIVNVGEISSVFQFLP
jgi:hypothetical protein